MSRALVLAIGFVLPLLGCRPAAGEGDWVPIRRDDLVLGVDVTGKLAAVNSDLLGPPPVPDKWDFKISQMAPEGAAVKKGDVVLAFDAMDLKRTLEQKENERDAAQKEIDKQISNAKMARRDEELRIAEADARLRKAALTAAGPTDLTGSIELAAAKLDLTLAQAELAYQQQRAAAAKKQDDTVLASLHDKRNRAEARLKETQEYIGRMTIGAPRAGTVIYVSNWNDQKKKIGDSAWRAEKVLETVVLDEMTAKGEVDEVDGSKMAVGRRVTLRLDALADVTYSGTVKSIGKTVQRQSKKNPLKIVRLDIALDKTDSFRMRPGMRFKGTAEIERIPKALVIPTSAIFLTERGPVAYRRVSRGHEAVALKLGKRNKDYAEVLEGLSEGDEVSRSDLASSAAEKK
jgi:multidrug efflux pump subunit AcrA (membrane-fusion protein)